MQLVADDLKPVKAFVLSTFPFPSLHMRDFRAVIWPFSGVGLQAPSLFTGSPSKVTRSRLLAVWTLDALLG